MPSSVRPQEIFDPTTWRQLCKLIENEDTSFLESLFRNYLDAANANLETLRNSNDDKARRRAAHTLFGSSMSVGVSSVATISRKLELELGRIPVEDMAERLAKIESHLRRVEKYYPLALADVSTRQSA